MSFDRMIHCIRSFAWCVLVVTVVARVIHSHMRLELVMVFAPHLTVLTGERVLLLEVLRYRYLGSFGKLRECVWFCCAKPFRQIHAILPCYESFLLHVTCFYRLFGWCQKSRVRSLQYPLMLISPNETLSGAFKGFAIYADCLFWNYSRVLPVGGKGINHDFLIRNFHFHFYVNVSRQTILFRCITTM